MVLLVMEKGSRGNDFDDTKEIVEEALEGTIIFSYIKDKIKIKYDTVFYNDNKATDYVYNQWIKWIDNKCWWRVFILIKKPELEQVLLKEIYCDKLEIEDYVKELNKISSKDIIFYFVAKEDK